MEGIRHHDFSLPAEDEALLDASFPSWETLKYNNENWVLVHNFDSIPKEYNCDKITVAFLIPINYPRTQIDMFYVYPHLSLQNKVLSHSLAHHTIAGMVFAFYLKVYF